MVWNNWTALSTCITSIATSSTYFGVLVYVIGFFDPFVEDPSSCSNLLPRPNSNGCPSANLSLLTSTCSSSGLNFAKGVYVSTLFVYSPVAYRPLCVYCCCCCCYCYYYKCCYKC
jgi:hypothetical protein